MMAREFDANFYQMFANNCGTRMGRLVEMIGQYREGSASAHDLLGTVRMTLHNVTGEAKLLGLPQLSRLLVMLTNKLKDIPDGKFGVAHANRLGTSCDLLAKAAQALENEAKGDTELQALEKVLKDPW